MSTEQVALVRTLRYEAKGIISVELVPTQGHHFQPFTAGSHIDLHLPNGLVRSYSLLNSADDNDRYVLGILLDRNSRGGSRYVHDQLKVGQQINISQPRNNFELDETAKHSVLVAGGIGITPIYCMLVRLLTLGHSVELIYCARTRDEAAYVAELEKLNINITWHFNDEKAGAIPPLADYLAGQEADSHFYCCGPTPMLNAFEAACEKLHYPNVHVERFSAEGLITEPQALHGYTVELAKSGKTLQVPEGKSLLDTLLDNGVNVQCACREGVCGSCETKVLEGMPDHRDGVLTKKEKEANNVMMVCVSGCKGERLVLDL